MFAFNKQTCGLIENIDTIDRNSIVCIHTLKYTSIIKCYTEIILKDVLKIVNKNI